MQEAADRFEWIILDTPPIGVVSDAALLCPMVDAALLVVRAGRTPHGDVERAIEALGRDRIAGIVLNGVEEQAAPAYGYYYTEQVNRNT